MHACNVHIQTVLFFLFCSGNTKTCILMNCSKFLLDIPASLQLSRAFLHLQPWTQSTCSRYPCKHGTQSTWTAYFRPGFVVPTTVLNAKHLHTRGSPLQSSYLSDPENKGHRQKGVNFDTLGAWNSRLEMTIDIEKSIAKGRLIPEIPIGKNFPFDV